jgi:hypothetical protein
MTLDLTIRAGTVATVAKLEGFSKYETLCSVGGEKGSVRPCSAARADVLRLTTSAWSPDMSASAEFQVGVELPERVTGSVTTYVDDGRVEQQPSIYPSPEKNDMNSTLTKKASALVLNLTRVSSLRSLVVMLAGAIAAIACAWSASDDHSVRFNYNRTGRAFYRLPPLPLMYDVRAGKEFSTKQVEDFEYDEANYLDVSDANRPPTLNKQADEVWDRAMKAIYSDNFSETRTLLEKFLTLTHYPTDNDEETRQTRRNTAVDMLDAITAIDKGSKCI